MMREPDPDAICTSHIERRILTVRMQNRRSDALYVHARTDHASLLLGDLSMNLTYKYRKSAKDGKDRASIPVWVLLTKEEVEAIERLARSQGQPNWRRFIRDIAEDAVARKLARSTQS